MPANKVKTGYLLIPIGPVYPHHDLFLLKTSFF